MHRFFAFIAACVALLAGLLLMEPRASAIEFEQATSGEPIVVRLIHPDRQAAAVLRLFEGCAAPHPAAASRPGSGQRATPTSLASLLKR